MKIKVEQMSTNEYRMFQFFYIWDELDEVQIDEVYEYCEENDIDFDDVREWFEI